MQVTQLLVAKEKRKQVMDINGTMKTYKIKIKNPVMGVPITFLDKYCPEQFEIIGIDRYVENNPNYGHRFNLNGKEVYARILIRYKK